MVYKITCPRCRRTFSLKTSNPASVMSKQFRCPKCGCSAPYSSLMSSAGVQDNPALHTHIVGGGLVQNSMGTFGEKKTRVTGQAMMGMKLSLVVESTGASFPLMPGTYILGRASSDSKATLKLAPDPYMSRQHAKLVVKITTGPTLCELSGLTSTNPIFVNGKMLNLGHTVRLSSGDKILLGMTTVILRRI